MRTAASICAVCKEGMGVQLTSLTIGALEVPLYRLEAAVVGSGSAGLAAADRLWSYGRHDIALLTEGLRCGTSRNAGSDKQTYYKLSLGGDEADSVMDMARDLFAGGGVNGDTALAEAAGSVRAFLRLVELGVPFPTDAYGGYVGYQTDHDLRRRATSAGPLTSRYMTEALERAVREKGVPILDGFHVVRLLVDDGRIEGLLCLDEAALHTPTHGLTVVLAPQVILATGGPAGCYARSVYPESQTGMSGMALEAGAQGANLQEWQYGLASVGFRWNVSGTYQQVLPRYLSIDDAGREREFLPEAYPHAAEALDQVFRKGYQWPFDAGKVTGSTRIDLLVHHETAALGRRVYLDYRSDPRGLEEGFGVLDTEARTYLTRSRALLPTPLARLQRMNPAAIKLYRRHGIDLTREPLEIAVCAQHHNGGLAVDAHWQTTITGLYAVGEAAGTFGLRRPGGSALNAGQVGAQRAAEQIACTAGPLSELSAEIREWIAAACTDLYARLGSVLQRARPGADVLARRRQAGEEMSRWAGHMRDVPEMERLAASLRSRLAHFDDMEEVRGPADLPALLKNRDLLITQAALLSAMCVAAEEEGSAGSALVLHPTGAGIDPHLPYRYRPARPSGENRQLLTIRQGDGFTSRYAPVRPLPEPDDWFETAWAAYRQRTARLPALWRTGDDHEEA